LAAFTLLAIASLTSPGNALKALLVADLLIVGNASFIHFDSNFSILKWLPLIGTAGRATWELTFHSSQLSKTLRLWLFHSVCSYLLLCGIQLFISSDPLV